MMAVPVEERQIAPRRVIGKIASARHSRHRRCVPRQLARQRRDLLRSRVIVKSELERQLRQEIACRWIILDLRNPSVSATIDFDRRHFSYLRGTGLVQSFLAACRCDREEFAASHQDDERAENGTGSPSAPCHSTDTLRSSETAKPASPPRTPTNRGSSSDTRTGPTASCDPPKSVTGCPEWVVGSLRSAGGIEARLFTASVRAQPMRPRR